MNTTSNKSEKYRKSLEPSSFSSTIGPLWIKSSQKSHNHVQTQQCICPFKNNLTQGTRISITTCKNWSSFQWIMDYEGKIISYLNPNLCIQLSGKWLTLEFCRNGRMSQQWIYNSNGKGFHSVQNGQKKMTIKNNSRHTPEWTFVTNTKYSSMDSQSFDIMYNYDFTYLQPVPSNSIFPIISHLYTNNQVWCLYPKNNSLLNGNQLSISKCKSWDSYKWSIDSEGKVLNYRDPRKCITKIQSRLIIRECINGNHNQKWMYSVFDEKLVWMKNSNWQVVVKDNVGAENANVKLFKSENVLYSPSHHKWDMDPL